MCINNVRELKFYNNFEPLFLNIETSRNICGLLEKKVWSSKYKMVNEN